MLSSFAPFASAQSTTPTTSKSTGGVLVPLYMGPGPSWLALIADKKAEPNVPIIAIINPLSGPSIFNATYLSYIDQLRIANITVIGYVYTDYGNRVLSAVESDIT